MAGFTCPFCNHDIALSSETTYRETYMSKRFLNCRTNPPDPGQIGIKYYFCPNCGEISITIDVECDSPTRTVYLRPQSFAKKYPDYIPLAIRRDYEEACAIATLSPRASATLSRRCIQGMIRDFWGFSKSRLVDEIEALKDKVPASQWKILHALRRIGNIGAHPEADVSLIIDIDPEDAIKILKVIELLINQWYIERHAQQELYKEIGLLDETTQADRKKTE